MSQFHIHPSHLDKALQEIEDSIQSIEDSYKYKIMFICEELLTNIIRHGDFEARTPDIYLEIKSETDIYSFSIECKDNAKAFNMLKYPDPNIHTDIEERQMGGLGIYLTKKYAKELHYSFENGYNILRLSL
jgi:serine/threonine-protein kinase RsbW